MTGGRGLAQGRKGRRNNNNSSSSSSQRQQDARAHPSMSKQLDARWGGSGRSGRGGAEVVHEKVCAPV